MDYLNDLFDTVKNLPWNALVGGAVPLLVGYGAVRLVNLLRKGRRRGSLSYPFRLEVEPGWVKRLFRRNTASTVPWRRIGDACTFVVFFTIVYLTFLRLPLPYAEAVSLVAASLSTYQVWASSRRLQDSLVLFRDGLQFRGDFVRFEDLSLSRDGDSVVFLYRKTRVTMPFFRFDKVAALVADEKTKVRYEALKTRPATTPGGPS